MPDYSGSFSGSFQGSISGSLIGSGIYSSSAQIDFTAIPNKPAQSQYITPFQSNQIKAFTEFKQGSVLTPGTFPYFSASIQDRIVSQSQNTSAVSSSIVSTISSFSSSIATRMSAIENDVDATGSDAQTLSFNPSTNALTISNGNSVDLSALAGGGGGSGLAITASDEGSVLSVNVRSIDFVGNGVVATNTGNAITITINTSSNGSDTALSQSTNPLTTFDGNRVVSNTNLPAGVYNTNFATSGSLANFIEKVFFPNSVPVITTTGFTIQEFEVSGSVVGIVSATDAEAQSITFRTSSLYTADLFKISSAGQITLNTKSTASMNTDTTPGSGSHPFLVEAVDTFFGVGSQTVYIRVNPNTAPVWRQTSTGGSIVTSYTQSLNENSTAANNKVRVYFTDAESDTITIGTGSVPSEFSLTLGATYVQLNQVTASLDYETTTHYNFVLTASDQHYQDGDDSDSITYLPFRVSVVDNVVPVVNNQTLTAINENSSNGTTVGSITATDSESDTIVFSNFTLISAYLNSVGTNITSSLGGTSLYDPHADPFQCTSGGSVTRKNGVYLNSDVADRYVYLVTVSDAYNTTTDTAEITIPIDADASSTIGSDTQTYYIVESAVSGADLTTNTDGYTAGSITYSSAVSQMWKVNSSPAGYVRFTNGTTQYTGSTSLALELASHISGSIYTSGSTIQVQVTASETSFETTKQYRTHTLRVTPNLAPIIASNTVAYSSYLNTNGARSPQNLAIVSFGEPQPGIGDTINHSSFQLVSSSAGFSHLQSGDNYYIYANTNVPAGTYTFSGSVADSFGKVGSGSASFPFSITIAQAPVGTLTTNGTFYVIETARSGALIYTSTNGRSGTQGDLGVTYSPQYNLAAVQSFTSSNALVGVTSTGAISIAQNVSGSYTSGQTFTSNITFRDQYNNIGSGSITINVASNSVPTASFTPITTNLTASISANTGLVSASITDMETDTPFLMSLGGTNGSDLYAVPQNANSSSYVIKNVSTISSGQTLTYDATITDVHGKSRTYSSNTITISDQIGLVYGYGWSGGSAANQSTAIASLGDTDADGIGITSGSVIAMLQSGSLGSTFTPSYIGGACTLHKSSSLSTMSDTSATGISTLGYFNFSSTSQRLLIIFPSASNLGGKPASMYDGVPPDSIGTANEYYTYAKDAAIPGTIGTGVYYFDLQSAYQGYTRWGMIFAEGKNTNNSRYYLMPDTASVP
jgi:hypothetical protein